MKAKEIMTRNVVTVAPDAPVAELAKILAGPDVSALPVIDDGELVGIVTEEDLVDRAKRIHLPTVINILDAVIPIAGERQYQEDLRKMAARTAGDIMSVDVVVVDEETEMEEAATLLSERRATQLPVMRDGVVVGIIGKRDVIRGMLKDDGSA